MIFEVTEPMAPGAMPHRAAKAVTVRGTHLGMPVARFRLASRPGAHSEFGARFALVTAPLPHSGARFVCCAQSLAGAPVRRAACLRGEVFA
jgi:hypothetical protein